MLLISSNSLPSLFSHPINPSLQPSLPISIHLHILLTLTLYRAVRISSDCGAPTELFSFCSPPYSVNSLQSFNLLFPSFLQPTPFLHTFIPFPPPSRPLFSPYLHIPGVLAHQIAVLFVSDMSFFFCLHV